jgi:hemerythrin superfamily protein
MRLPRRRWTWEQRLPTCTDRPHSAPDTQESPMATAKKAASKKTPARKSTSSASSSASATGSKTDAVKLLTADHREVKSLFQEYQKLVDHDAEDDEKHPIAQQICQMLTVHAQVEEELFYPAAQEAIKDPDLVDEAAVEHTTAKDLIAQLEASDPSDELFDAKVKVLGEYIDHHVKEEEGQLFPQARKARMDLQAMGEQIQARKAELMAELGMGQDEEASADGIGR